jgi:pimeloyl-ACP methyl ester carboxylesterase
MNGVTLGEHPARRTLLAGVSMDERRLDLNGVSTSVLDGGDGPTLVLLHGPGEFAAGWLPALPALLRTHRIVAPDLPGHGASQVVDGDLTGDRILGWLDALIEHTCPSPPVLVGRTIGGAIGARYALDQPDRLARLVLVDTLGLAPFEPAPRFALAMHRYFAEPDRANYERFMEFCMYDLGSARSHLGSRWEPFATYAVDQARSASGQAALGRMLAEFGTPLDPGQLDRIRIPTTLIWGRDDLATPLAVAEAAAKRHGWPLHVIDEAGDDPTLDQPARFVEALRTALDAGLVTPERAARP